MVIIRGVFCVAVVCWLRFLRRISVRLLVLVILMWLRFRLVLVLTCGGL